MSFDAGSIEATLHLDRSPFQRELAAAIIEAEAFADKTFSAKIGLDQHTARNLRAELGRLDQSLTQDARQRMTTGQGSILGTLLGITSTTPARQGISQQKVAAGEWAAAERMVGEAAAAAGAKSVAAAGASTAAAEQTTATLRQTAEAQEHVGNEAVAAAAKATAAWRIYRATLQRSVATNMGGAFPTATAAAGGAGGGAGTAAATGAAAGGAGRGMGGAIGLLKYPVPVGAGMLPLGLGSIALWQLLVDILFEIIAVVVPATVAFLAFGAAGFKAGKDIVFQLLNIHTVAKATGEAIYPLKGGFEALDKAVRPQVYQLFGEALTLIGQKGGNLTRVATGAGAVLDRIGARAVAAMTTGGMGTFINKGVPALEQGLTLFGNLFGIFGNILKMMPGYAAMLLHGLVMVTHAIENITSSQLVQWIAKVVETVKGGVLWFGLLATGASLLVPITAKLINSLAGVAAAGHSLRNLGTSFSAIQKDASKVTFANKIKAGLQDISANTPIAITRIRNVGVAVGETAGRTGLLARATNLLRAVPIGAWYLAGAAALSFLVYKLVSARSETQRWLDSMQAGLQGLTIAAGVRALELDQLQVAMRLVEAHRELEAAVSRTGDAQLRTVTHSGRGLQILYQNELQNVSELSAGQRQLNEQYNRVTYRVGVLSRTYGSHKTAMGLITASGVTMREMLDGNQNAWAQVKVRVEATRLAYLAMGQTGGRLGADMAVMNHSVDDQFQAMTKLNQAWDAWTSEVIAGQVTTDAWLLGMRGLPQHLRNAADAFNGISKADIEFNQNLEQTLPQMRQVLDQVNLAGFSNRFYNRTVADMVASYLPYLRGNDVLLGQLKAISGGAIPDNITSYGQLVKWLRRTGASTDDLRKNQRDLRDRMAEVTNHITGMSSAINNQLLKAMAAAIANTPQLTADVRALNRVISQNNPPASAMHRATQKIIDDMVAAGIPIQQRKRDLIELGKQFMQVKLAQDQQSNATRNKTIKDLWAIADNFGLSRRAAIRYISALTGIPTRIVTRIIEEATGTGQFSIKEYPWLKGAAGQGYAPSPPGKAAGAYVTTGRSAIADDNLMLVSRGELVVPTHIVDSGAVDHLRGMIPGFALGTYNAYTGTPPGLGRYAQRQHQRYYRDFTDTLELDLLHTMQAAIRKAMRDAAAAASAGGGGPVSGDAAAAMAYAQSLLRAGIYGWGMGQWPSWRSLGMGESGWNRHAENASSGAYGIPQALPYSKMPRAAWPERYGGQSAMGPQVNWMASYIRSVYGNPDGAWMMWQARSPHWYDRGGPLPPGAHIAINRTGRTEEILSPEERHAFVQIAKSANRPAMAAVEYKLDKLIAAVELNASQTASGLAAVLNGTARQAIFSSAYSVR